MTPPHGPRAYLFGIAIRPAAKLLYRVILEGGWRDGWRGLLKVGLDAGSDALVWGLVLADACRGRSPVEQGSEPSEQAGRHFGRRPTGPPKVMALARKGRSEAQARQWLSALARAGVDVALVCDGAVVEERSANNGDDGLPGQQIPRLTLLRTMRALDLEMQIRTAHAVVPFGARARLLAQLLPGALTPSIAGVEASAKPAQTIERLRAEIAW